MKTNLYILVLALVAGIVAPAQAALNRHACMACTVETPTTVLDDFRHYIRQDLDLQMDAMRDEAILELREQFGIDAPGANVQSVALVHAAPSR